MIFFTILSGHISNIKSLQFIEKFLTAVILIQAILQCLGVTKAAIVFSALVFHRDLLSFRMNS